MNRRRRSDQGPQTSTLVLLARITGIGWYVAISIAGGALAGAWLDERFGTRPALLLAGLAVGLMVAFLGMIQLLRKFASGAIDISDAHQPDEEAKQNTDRLDR